MQYRTGTVTIANGSTTVTGLGTQWKSRISSGNLFKVQGETTIYTISSITSDTILILSSTYSGVQSGASYIIETSITPGLGLADVKKDSVEWADFVKYSLDLLDSRYYRPNSVTHAVNRGRFSFVNKLPTTAETTAGISRGLESVSDTPSSLLEEGLMCYELGTDYGTKKIKYYNGTAWKTLKTIAPVVSSISPSSSLTSSTLVTINGNYFGSAQGSSYMTFNATVAGSAEYWSDTIIQVYFPQDAGTGNLTVTVNGLTSNATAYT